MYLRGPGDAGAKTVNVVRFLLACDISSEAHAERPG